jgi:hypothetical protein
MNAHDPELVIQLANEIDGHVDEDTVNAVADALDRAELRLSRLSAARGSFSAREIERALAAAGLEEYADDDPYWTGRMDAADIVRDTLGLNTTLSSARHGPECAADITLGGNGMCQCVTPPAETTACGATFQHDWHGYLDGDGRTRVCDGEPRVMLAAVRTALVSDELAEGVVEAVLAADPRRRVDAARNAIVALVQDATRVHGGSDA